MKGVVLSNLFPPDRLIILLISGLYYKHVTIINYASSSINKFKSSLNDNARVIIYDRHMYK
jgi:hypothetical protein